jgi:uncharacterized membrane protein
MPSRRDDEQLTEYLARLRNALEALPKSEREEAYRELSQHVESLVNEAVLTGDKEETAVRDALERFGDPEKIGQKIASDYWAQAFCQMQQRKRVRRPWFENNLSWLSALIFGFAFNTLLHFHWSPAAVISLSVTIGPLFGATSGWRQAQARKRIWMEDEAEANRRGEPTVQRRKLPTLIARESPPLILAALIGLIFSLRLPAANDNKWTFVFLCATFLGNLITTDVSQRFFLLRDKERDIDDGGKKAIS